jgi:hypothetical protein
MHIAVRSWVRLLPGALPEGFYQSMQSMMTRINRLWVFHTILFTKAIFFLFHPFFRNSVDLVQRCERGGAGCSLDTWGISDCSKYIITRSCNIANVAGFNG